MVFRLVNRMKYTGPRISIAVICVSLLVACATPMKVVTDYDSSVDLGQYRTYAWAADTALIAARGLEVPVSPAIVRHIETAIEGELAAKGYRRVEPDETPCFVVSFTVRAAEPGSTPAGSTHRGVLYGRSQVYGPPEDTYQEVHLASIEIFDGTTRQQVWHGAVSRVALDPESTIADEAYAIIGEFPPAV